MKRFLPCCVLLGLQAHHVFAEGTTDWRQFRGTAGQGVSQAKNVPVSWTTRKGVAWKKELPGKGWSSPVISDGMVVVTASNEERGKVSLGVLAVDAATGDLRWGKTLFTPGEKEAKARHSKNGLASGTPVIEDGIVYAHFGHMGTAALKLADGEVLWTQKIEYEPVHGTGASPVVVEGLLVFSADGASDPMIVALDKRSGKIAWKTPRGQEVKKTFSFGTPLVIEIGGRPQIVSSASGMVAAYDPKDGSVIWKVRYGEGYSVVPRPVYANGLLYVSSGFDRARLLAIDPRGAKGDVTGTHVVFEEDDYIPKTPSFVEGGGYLYLVDDATSVTCRDAKTGELQWREKLPGNFSSSPVLAGGHLYLATEDGVAYVMSVSPKGGKVVTEVEMGERIFASPAIVDGALFIRSERHLWKIGGGE